LKTITATEKLKRLSCCKLLVSFLRPKALILMIACMLGVSYVILQEERMVLDTGQKSNNKRRNQMIMNQTPNCFRWWSRCLNCILPHCSSVNLPKKWVAASNFF